MKHKSLPILSYTAVIQEDTKGNYLISFPALPGCHTFGRTFDEALRMGQEVLELWLEELADSGEPLPKEHRSSFMIFQTSKPKTSRRTSKLYATAHRKKA